LIPGDILKAKNGDASALNHLLDTYKHLAYSVAFKYVQHKDDAEDVVQEAFIKVFLNIRKFKNESKFSTWLFKIVYHETLKYIKEKKMYEDLDEVASVTTEIEESEDIRIDNVRQAMAALTKKEYVMINLFYVAEKNIKEIAIITN
jgi:RNA polymerase sigma factor (sigma-70 family)